MKVFSPLAPVSLLVLSASLPAALPAQPSTQVQALHEAAYTGDEVAVVRLLEAGVAVDAQDVDGRTALMWAGFNGHTEVVAYLLENGAAVAAKEASGRTPLMYASSGPFADTVKLLLESGGAEVNVQGTAEGFTALMGAAAEGQVEVVRLLLAHGADPALKDTDGDTAESFARENGHSEVVAALRAAPPVDKP